MRNFKELLTEALIDIDASDINKLYAPLTKPLKVLEEMLNKPVDMYSYSDYEEVFNKFLTKGKYTPLKTFSSAELKSKAAQDAHAIKPITIEVYLIVTSNSYLPNANKIALGLPSSMVNLITSYSPSMWAHQHLKSIKAEVTPLKMKSTIRHELTHWVDDAMHGRYIDAAFTKMSLAKTKSEQEQIFKKMVAKNKPDVYLAPLEINAAANQVAEIKRRISARKFDSLTWSEFVELVPGFHALNSSQHAVEWRKLLFTRLARENLIGKNFMKNLKS